MRMNPKSVEATIRRLTREIEQIDSFVYGGSENDDRVLHAGMLERKRDDRVRSAVLQMHTAIEELLNLLVAFRITGNRSRPFPRSESGRALHKLLFGSGSIGFDMKLNLALSLGIINGKTRDRLAVLNTVRNKCSHNFILKAPVRRGKRPAQRKPPLLIYEGRDLHGVAALEGFMAEYGQILVRLFKKTS